MIVVASMGLYKDSLPIFEGSILTQEQTALLFEEGFVPPSDDVYRAKDIEEMSGHFLMLDYMLTTLGKPLTEEVAKRLYYEL